MSPTSRPGFLRRSRRRSPRLLRSLLGLLLLTGLLAPTTGASADDSYPFRNPDLPLATRVADLVSRLTLDEKVSLLHQYQPAIPRLGIPAFKTGTEALHGVAWLGTATVFPQAIGLASTWDPSLIKQVGSAVGDEARGKNSENPAYNGLNLWAPVVNLLRDPRWGRNEEGYSEDTTLNGAISTAYGKGMEGDNPTYLKAAPPLKHYLAYNTETSRDTYSANVPQRVLNEYDRAAFQPAISANAATGVMASYNLVNGRPNTVSPDLDLIRTWTDKTLMNVTDAYAPGNLTGSEQYYATTAEGDAAAIKAGMDSFTQDDANAQPTITAVTSALAAGLLTEADINKAVTELLTIRFRLGDFDPAGRNPYASITSAAINSPANQALARTTARDSMVLLKNSKNALPLSTKTTKKIAVIGQLEDTLYEDWYSGTMPYKITPKQGITERLGAGGTVTSSEGVDRIALKDVATGKYVTATGPTDSDSVQETATTPTAAAQFDAFDWGEGVLALRNVANGKYLGYSWGPFITKDTQPNGWFVQQQFKLEQQADGSYVIHYVGYETRESWFGSNDYVTVGADGALALGSATAAGAAHFTKDTVSSGVDSAVAAAKGADTAVVVVGSMPFINGRENNDRNSLDLPAGQEAVVQAVKKANPHTVVVLESSYPETINWEQANVPAILWTSHAGEETGHALADLLFGDYSPSGHLTQTWYSSINDLPGKLDYDIIKAGWTYQYYQGTPLYPFGYGLSYGRFRYSNLNVGASSVSATGKVPVTVDVTNTGSRAADEVVQLYTTHTQSRVTQPIRKLQTFQKVRIGAHQTVRVHLTLAAADLKFWDVTRSRWVVESGRYGIEVGASSSDIRQRSALTVRGEVIPARHVVGTATRAENFDDYSATQLIDETKAAGTAVGGTAGSWLKFADSNLGRGATAITLAVSKADTAPATIQVRLGNPVTGPVVGTVSVPSTGDRYSWTTASAALHGASGVRDLYLVFTGPANVSSFTITGG